MSQNDAFTRIREDQIAQFGGFTPAARVLPQAESEVMKLLGELPMGSTPQQIASKLDGIEASRDFLFRNHSQQGEHMEEEARKRGDGTIFGVPLADVASFTPREKLELANSGGKALPPGYVLRRKGMGK